MVLIVVLVYTLAPVARNFNRRSALLARGTYEEFALFTVTVRTRKGLFWIAVANCVLIGFSSIRPRLTGNR